MLVDLPPAGEVWPRAAMIVHGTVVRDGEDHTSERILEAAGPWFATTFHALWEFSPDLLDAVPGGAVWRDQMEVVRPETERHLAVHEGHIAVLTERDRAGIAAAGPSIMDSGWTGDAASIRSRLEQTAAGGVSEVVYTPAGPAIIDELESFAQACSIERT
jgi:5,10-methylenetetrahydromethanopterin reductase